MQFRGSIAGPTNSLCTLHVQDCSCPRNTRFRLSAHLAGRDRLPAGLQRRFQHSIHSPSPGLAWRTRKMQNFVFCVRASKNDVFKAVLKSRKATFSTKKKNRKPRQNRSLNLLKGTPFNLPSFARS